MGHVRGRVLRIGHRGAAGHVRENTLAAIEKGIALGSDYVEIDVQPTADQQLVVMHDKRVDRTTNGRGRVADLSLEQIRALDAGDGQRVPLLREVLELVNGRCGLMLEIITPGVAREIVAAVREANLRTPIVYACFLHHELLDIRAAEPQADTLALLEGVPVAGAQFALDAAATHVGLAFDSATHAFVHQLQASDLSVFVYTLNDPRDIELARGMGVDGVISDYPDRV
jgi:glycerophosphoryl diester phosphodiesterase